MTSSQEPLPALQQVDDQAILVHAFWRLLDDGEPVDPAALAAALERPLAAVVASLARLDQAGRVRRSPAGQVLGSLGLSVQPTRHTLLVGRRQRWTWCAYDAVGILGALGASGRVRSQSPDDDATINLVFQAGKPGHTDAVIFMAEKRYRSVVDDWCPLVNLFKDPNSAATWAEQRSLSGATVPVAQATAVGAAAWRALLWPDIPPEGDSSDTQVDTVPSD